MNEMANGAKSILLNAPIIAASALLKDQSIANAVRGGSVNRL
jgi:hypothetical protein